MVDLAGVLAEQHREMRALLADLTRQQAITETIPGPQLRARRRTMAAVERAFLAQTAMRLRHLWPALREACPDGHTYTTAAWHQARGICYRMAKREWYGERDAAINDLEDHIADDLEKHVWLEERHLSRLAAGGNALDPALAVRMVDDGPWPTRPHPDLPRSPRLAALMLRPLAAADRVRDRLGRSME